MLPDRCCSSVMLVAEAAAEAAAEAGADPTCCSDIICNGNCIFGKKLSKKMILD